MKWPKDGSKTVPLKELTTPVCRAIRFAYNARRRNTNKDVPWDGPPGQPHTRWPAAGAGV